MSTKLLLLPVLGLALLTLNACEMQPYSKLEAMAVHHHHGEDHGDDHGKKHDEGHGDAKKPADSHGH